jgi:hypothetical protein
MAEPHEIARMGPDELDIERKVARCRVLLSVFALLSVYLLPNNAALMRWSGFTGAPYHVEPYALLVFGAHLGYSIAVYGSLLIGLVPRGIVAVTTWVDIGTGAITAIVTEGPTSPFYAFFAFAVVAAGVRGGFRFAMVATAVSIWIYFCLIAFSASRTVSTDLTVFIMRPVYLAIIGYLVAYLGRLRLALEAKIAALQRAKERSEIARALHDGCVQTLAGTNLTLGSCQELVRRGRGKRWRRSASPEEHHARLRRAADVHPRARRTGRDPAARAGLRHPFLDQGGFRRLRRLRRARAEHHARGSAQHSPSRLRALRRHQRAARRRRDPDHDRRRRPRLRGAERPAVVDRVARRSAGRGHRARPQPERRRPLADRAAGCVRGREGEGSWWRNACASRSRTIMRSSGKG